MFYPDIRKSTYPPQTMKSMDEQQNIFIYGSVDGKSRCVVSMSIPNILKEGALNSDSVIKYCLTTANDGKTYKLFNNYTKIQ